MNEMTLPRAAQILWANFSRVDIAAKQGSPDQKFGAPDLRALQSDTYGELGQAASHVLNAPYAFLKLDTAAGNAPDGLVEIGDLARVAQRSTDDAVNVEQAAGILQQHFHPLDRLSGQGQPDGLIGRDDLQAAVFHPHSPPEVRDAALLLLGNAPVYREFDLGCGIGPEDGLISFADADAVQKRRVKERELEVALGANPVHSGPVLVILA